MSFKILLRAPDVDPSWPEKMPRAVPGFVVKAFVDPKDAVADIVDADAAYGTVHPSCWRGLQNCAGFAPTEPSRLVKGDVIGEPLADFQRRWII